MFDFDFPEAPRYYIYSTGTNLKPCYRSSRHDAEIVMHNYCNKHNIIVECTECDKHERKYSDHKSIYFYINRVR